MKNNYRYKSLASRVLAVAHYGTETWMVYIDTVPGMNHDDEFMSVAHNGEMLDERIAKILFPSIAEKNLDYVEDD